MMTQSEANNRLERHTEDAIKCLIPRSISDSAMTAYSVFESSVLLAVEHAPESELKTKINVALQKLASTFCP